MPIEGEWYTYTFRNALTGLIDPSRGTVYRDLQDSRTISIEDGGREVMRDGDRFLGYAGVVNQFATIVGGGHAGYNEEQARTIWNAVRNFLVKRN